MYYTILWNLNLSLEKFEVDPVDSTRHSLEPSALENFMVENRVSKSFQLILEIIYGCNSYVWTPHCVR
jgi:hypothetical protein